MALIICDHYDVILNKMVNSALDPIWLIQSTKNLGKISCLVVCNINKQCYTDTLTSHLIVNDNCFLYKRKQIASTVLFFIFVDPAVV
jgi:hypothetical protein